MLTGPSDNSEDIDDRHEAAAISYEGLIESGKAHDEALTEALNGAYISLIDGDTIVWTEEDKAKVLAYLKDPESVEPVVNSREEEVKRLEEAKRRGQ